MPVENGKLILGDWKKNFGIELIRDREIVCTFIKSNFNVLFIIIKHNSEELRKKLSKTWKTSTLGNLIVT